MFSVLGCCCCNVYEFFFILLLLLQNMDIACTVYVSTIYQSIWSNWIENTKTANGATDRIKYIECLIGKKKNSNHHNNYVIKIDLNI